MENSKIQRNKANIISIGKKLAVLVAEGVIDFEEKKEILQYVKEKDDFALQDYVNNVFCSGTQKAELLDIVKMVKEMK
jgi:hypothetical protein